MLKKRASSWDSGARLVLFTSHVCGSSSSSVRRSSKGVRPRLAMMLQSAAVEKVGCKPVEAGFSSAPTALASTSPAESRHSAMLGPWDGLAAADEDRPIADGLLAPVPMTAHNRCRRPSTPICDEGRRHLFVMWETQGDEASDCMLAQNIIKRGSMQAVGGG